VAELQQKASGTGGGTMRSPVVVVVSLRRKAHARVGLLRAKVDYLAHGRRRVLCMSLGLGGIVGIKNAS